METIFTLNMDEEEHQEDLSSNNTSQLLQDCLNLFQSPSNTSLNHHYNHNQVRKHTNNNPYNNHPDIQYFQKIKTKNHFNYHKSKHQTKWNTDRVSSSSSSNTIRTRPNTNKMSDFDPYNLDLLLSRIKSFNSLNWKTIDPAINELKCAINGWKCVSFGIKESKNHLICTFCNQQLILKSDDNSYESLEITPFDYNAMSGKLYDESFHKKLVSLYLKQIENSGHGQDCLWKNFETSIDGIYYLRQYLPNNDCFLIEQYCKNLKNLLDNLLILEEFSSDSFNSEFLSQIDELNSNFIQISNQWLLSKFFNDNKENFFNSGFISYNIPQWIYKLAIYGWSLNIQSYSNDTILVMSCNMCNERVFLNPTSSSKETTTSNLNLSLSKILTPVAYPMLHHSHNNNDDNAFESTSINDGKFDPKCHHKSWCSYLHNDLPKYFIEMLLHSEVNIGVNGEYIYDNDLMNIDTSSFNNVDNDDGLKKRRRSFNVNEGLERLSKLRKLYFIDE